MTENRSSPAEDDWSVRFYELQDEFALGEAWRELQLRAEYSFFQSWGWMHSWIRTFPASATIYVLEVFYREQCVGLSVLGRNVVSAGGFFASQAFFVSEVGNPDDDALTVEHSGLLIQAGMEMEVLTRSFAHLLRNGLQWDELLVSGIQLWHARTYCSAAHNSGLVPVVREEHPFYFVDVADLRNRGIDYIDTLSSNTRYQIRRSKRLYDSRGEVKIRIASTLCEALAFFEDLKRLHQSSWESRGAPGAFATSRMSAFHDALIRECFDDGSIQLIKVSVDGQPMGYLYNFVLAGRVSNYQTAFVYEANPHLKPGLVSHTLEIEHAYANGADVYDFLMGDHRYKRSLAKNSESMVWLSLSRRTWRLRMRSFTKWVAGCLRRG